MGLFAHPAHNGPMTTTTRAQLHRLVNALPDAALDTAGEGLARVADPEAAPPDRPVPAASRAALRTGYRNLAADLAREPGLPERERR